MPIQLPDLDNRTFAGLMDEMTASIPKYTREWTNFNPSDPGMTILELLAWISESLIYRANRVSAEAYLNFLSLVAGDTIFDEKDQQHKAIFDYLGKIKAGELRPDIEAMKGEATAFLNSRYRAITEEDFRELAREASDKVKRVEVVIRPYYMEVVVIPASVPTPEESDQLCMDVSAYLAPRKLIGTALKVTTASYASIPHLEVRAVSYGYAKAEEVRGKVEDTLRNYFDPVTGGPSGAGWPYGRDIIVYELCGVIEKVPGIKMVKEITAGGLPFLKIKIDGLIDNRKSSSPFEITITGEHEEKGV